jgi:PAS domain S-box-containing protein
MNSNREHSNLRGGGRERDHSEQSIHLAASLRYGLAILSVGVALGAGLLLQQFHFRVPAATLLLIAVAIASWYAGRGPAVLAVILATTSCYWFFVEPIRTIYINYSEIPYFIIFTGFAVLLCWLGTIRRRIEAGLQEQANLLNLTHDAIFVIDMGGMIKYWNRGAEERYGWTAEQAVGKVVHDLLKTVFPAPVEEVKAEAARTGRWEGEILHTKKDGAQVAVASRWALQRDARGAPVAILETNNDITERKRAEAELRASEERFRTLVQFSFDVYWETDAEHRFTRQEFAEGLADAPAPGSEIGKTRWEVPYLEPDEEAWQEHRATLDAHLPFRDFELARPTPDGGKRYVSVSGLPVFDATGRFLGYRGVGRHITDRKRADEALRQSEAYLTEAQRLSHTGSWALDVASGKYVYASEEFFRIFGLEAQEGLPSREDLSRLIHPEDWDRANGSFEKQLRDKVDITIEYRIVLSSGRVKHVHAIRHPVLNEAGEVVQLVGTVVDVTDRKRAEEERQRHLWFLESLDRINRAMQGSSDLERMLSDVLGAVLAIFACDRAWLVYPCDPEAASWKVSMEHTRPEFPGAFALGLDLPVAPEIAQVFQAVRASSGPVRFGQGSASPLPPETARRFSIQSMIGMAIYPKGDRPYMLGLHQCAGPRVWTPQEERLFQEIGRRLTDALTSVLIFRSLRESERKLEEAQRIAHVGYWDRDLDAGRITLSDEGCRIFGFPPEERVVDLPVWHERWQALIHPEDRPRAAAAAAAALAGGPRYDVEYRVVHRTGEVRVVHSQGDVIRDASGRPCRMFGTMQDITDRKRAEQALRQSQAYLAEAERLSHTGSWAFDVAGNKYVYASEECGRIFEFDAQEDLPTREAVSRLIHPEDWPRVNEAFEKSVREKVDTASEFRITLPSGRAKHIHAIRHPVLNDAGEVVKLVGTVMDITERKRAEEALRRSEAYLAEGQRLSHTGSWAWNPLTEQCFYWSEEMFRIFEIDPQQGLPTSEIFWARIYPEDRESMRELLGKTALEKSEYVHDHRILLPDGTVKHIHAIGHPVLDEAGELVEFIGTAIDVTERKRAEQQRERLRQLEADLAHINRVSLMGELTASIAHEVNQPLAGVVSNAGASLRWLAGDPPNLDKAREAVSRIVRDGKRAGEVIARVRALTRRAATSQEKLDLNQTIQEVLALVQDEAKRRSVSIQTEFGDDLAPIAGDRVQVQQVVLNLLMNGIEAMSSVEGRARDLALTTRNLDPDQVQVTIEDSGTGLDPNAMDKIFDPFYTTKPSGMGMGLAICRSILEAHGGRLWAAAKDGPGTLFHFTLPKHHEEESHA